MAKSKEPADPLTDLLAVAHPDNWSNGLPNLPQIGPTYGGNAWDRYHLDKKHKLFFANYFK